MVGDGLVGVDGGGLRDVGTRGVMFKRGEVIG